MERYYAIKSNYEFNEFDNIKRAIESDGWLFILIWNFEPNRGFEVNNISFINRYETQSSNKIKISDWSASIDSLRDYKFDYTVRAKFRFISPDGRIKYFDIGNYTGIKNIIQSMKKLVELSIYNNWEQYDLVIENDRLKIEIESLKNTIEINTIEIKELQNKICNQK